MVLARIAQGELEGSESGGIHRFAGIPYAAPPVGERRWRAPEPPESWTGRRDATKTGPIAPQQDFMSTLLGFEPEPQDEDCLFLNVFTPGVDDARRPVMVWIHGGAYVMGSGSEPGYDGAALARRGDVVVVSINYRLGAFGYLHLADLDPSYDNSGNLGVLDHIAALEWVRDNIGGFGGDPENVTIFGESAGGMSVGTLLGTPAARGLFHKAIPESGASDNVSPIGHASEVTQQLLTTLGVADIDALLRQPVDAIVNGQQDFVMRLFTDGESLLAHGAEMRLPFQPVVDGVVLPEPAIEAVRKGSVADVQLLVGTCRDEWKLFQFMDPQQVDDAALEVRMTKLFGEGDALDVYREALPGASAPDLFGAAITDLVFRQPAIRLCEAALAGGSSVHSYLFTWASPMMGACHGLEVPFVFGNLSGGLGFLIGDNPPSDLVDLTQESWLAFARTGDPSNDTIGEWPAYDLATRPTMQLDVPHSILHDPESERRELWSTVR